MQYLNERRPIRGDEKYLPDNQKRNLGLFTLQSVESRQDPVRGRGAGRYPRGCIPTPTRRSLIWSMRSGRPMWAPSPVSRDFTAWSGSLGANYEILPGWRAGLSVSHSERAPGVNELFSFGPHGGSEQFLEDNPDLRILKRATAPSSASTARLARFMSRAAFTTATSPTSSSRPRPARSRMACPSINIGRGRPIITASSSRAT